MIQLDAENARRMTRSKEGVRKDRMMDALSDIESEIAKACERGDHYTNYWTDRIDIFTAEEIVSGLEELGYFIEMRSSDGMIDLLLRWD